MKSRRRLLLIDENQEHGQLLRMSGLVPRGFTVETTAWNEEGLLIAARPSVATGRCPNCGMISDRVHSRYERGLADLPMSGRRVRLVSTVRRFHCDAATCARQIFAERFDPDVLAPYVKAQKNDDRDAEAIAEAATRPTMRFVPVKSQAQSDLQSLHRARERLVGDRTALINHLRALLLELGIIVAQGRSKLAKEVHGLLGSEIAALSPRIRTLVEDLFDDWTRLDARIKVFDAEFVATARADTAMRRLSTVPGIGPINATALVAAVGDAAAFAKGRDMAVWLGLVPRQVTTGGKPRLLGISKRGNRYLRKNLVHGARAALPRLVASDTSIGRWLRDLLIRRHKNVVVVAIANKLARICWAVLAGGRGFTRIAAA
jgi:transposase